MLSGPPVVRVVMHPTVSLARPAAPIGWLAAGVLALWMGVDDASAATMGGAVTSVGVVTTVATLLLVKGWQAHFGADGLSTLAGLVALATGAGLWWRSGVGLRALAAGRVARRPDRTPADARPPVALPAGIERGALIFELRRHFFELQAAWDAGSRDTMSRMTTPDMLAELCAASVAVGSAVERTEFLSVEAELLLFEQRDASQVVCVEFSGMVREAPAGGTVPFREFWMLTRPEDASAGWRLVRHQGLL